LGNWSDKTASRAMRDESPAVAARHQKSA
jgi:hypothetical protein